MRWLQSVSHFTQQRKRHFLYILRYKVFFSLDDLYTHHPKHSVNKGAGCRPIHPAFWRQEAGVGWLRQAKPTYQELFHHRETTNHRAPNATWGFIKTKGGLPDDGWLQDGTERLMTPNLIIKKRQDCDPESTTNKSSWYTGSERGVHAGCQGAAAHIATPGWLCKPRLVGVLHSRG